MPIECFLLKTEEFLKLTTKAGLNYFSKHRLQFLLSVLGIAIGVAIIVAIDIANYSTSRAFELSMNAVAGKATHRIKGTSEGIPDSLYTYLRTAKGLKNIAPVIEDHAILNNKEKRVFILLGIDVFAEKNFRDYFNNEEFYGENELRDFLASENTAAMSYETAMKEGVKKGDTIEVITRGRKVKLKVISLIKNNDRKSSVENLLICDIANAQKMTGKTGFINAIDCIAETDDEIKNLESYLPEGFTLSRSSSRTDIASQMMNAFSINLTALSMLALIVGIFLIYNTMTFSVVRRKQLIGTLRCLGVTADEIYILIVKEVLITGFIGTAIGFALGILISQSLLALVSRSINDLYFAVNVTEIKVSEFVIIKGLGAGIAASLISALKPAKEAASVKPGISSIRSRQEADIIRKIPKIAIVGVITGIAGTVLLLIPTDSVWLSYVAVLPVITGFALLTPLIIMVYDYVFSPVMKKVFGITGGLASRGIIRNISRTNAAIAALGIAVASTVGVGTMIHSFRLTVVNWLNNGLRADLYVSTPLIVSNRNEALLPDSLLNQILEIPNITSVSYYSELPLYQNGKIFNILATGHTDSKVDRFQLKEGNPEEVYNGFYNGEVIVSEPFSYRFDKRKGSVINLKTDYGDKEFKVAGVYYDYSNDQGFISIEYSVFRKYWGARGLSGISIHVDKEDNIEKVAMSLRQLQKDNLQLFIRTNKYLRESSIEVFDRTFIVAKVLQILSVIVAFIGILSSLMSLLLERGKEMGVLRSLGMLPSQIFKISVFQTTLMGFISAVVSIPLGYVLALILVYIINKRSFGWTMQFEMGFSIIIEAIILSIAAAVIAGLYPGYKMSKISPSVSLREE